MSAISIATPPADSPQGLQLGLLDALDAVAHLAEAVEGLPAADRPHWHDADLAGLRWLASYFSGVLETNAAHGVLLARAVQAGEAWAQALAIRQQGQPVPADLLDRARRELGC